MKVKYEIINGQPHLVAHDLEDWFDFKQISNKIWNFIYSHQVFPLRQYYRQCKNANVRSYYIEENHDITKGVTIVVLNSDWENHSPYLTILQSQLKLVIEDLPE